MLKKKKKVLDTKKNSFLVQPHFFLHLLSSFRILFSLLLHLLLLAPGAMRSPTERGPVLCQATPSAATDCYVLLQLLADGQFALLVNRFAQLFFLPIKRQDCFMSTPE